MLRDCLLRGGPDDREADALTPSLVVHAEGDRLGDLGMVENDALDLGWVDVDASGDDEVAAPAIEVQVAVIVEFAEVTDGEPVLVPGLDRLLRVSPVLEAGVRWDSAPDVAVIVDAKAAAGACLPNRAGVRVELLRRADGELPLGGSIELTKGFVSERGAGQPANVVGAGGSCMRHESHARVGRRCGLEQALQVGGGHERGRDLAIVDEP